MLIRSYALLGTCALIGGYAAIRDNAPSAAPASNAVVAEPVAAPRFVPPPRPPVLPSIGVRDEEPANDDGVNEEPIRGLDPISGPDELAMVFSVDGEWYLRLSEEERAESRGRGRMVVEGDTHSVVAPVSAAALPATFADWTSREVFVNGTCRSRVVGFAEISRAAGDPEDGYDEEGDEYIPGVWTVETLTAANITLAAKLDGNCSGTWARATDQSAPAVARSLEAPELEQDALADLLRNAEPRLTVEWSEMGGEGDWRDEVDVVTQTYQHPLTDERWVFVQARTGGYCGEPSVSLMAAYRAGDDGTLVRAATLDYAHSTLRDVVDVDGDGQPEMMFGEDDSSISVVDLANRTADSIYINSYAHEGCGC